MKLWQIIICVGSTIGVMVWLSKFCFHKWRAIGVTRTGMVIDCCDKGGRHRIMSPAGLGCEYSREEFEGLNLKRIRKKDEQAGSSEETR